MSVQLYSSIEIMKYRLLYYWSGFLTSFSEFQDKLPLLRALLDRLVGSDSNEILFHVFHTPYQCCRVISTSCRCMFLMFARQYWVWLQLILQAKRINKPPQFKLHVPYWISQIHFTHPHNPEFLTEWIFWSWVQSDSRCRNCWWC